MTGWPAMRPMQTNNLDSRLVLLALAVLLTAAAGSFSTVGAAARLDWRQLRPEEKLVLSPYARQWPDFSREKQESLRRGAHKWRRMTEKEKDLARERFKQWQLRAPEERQRIKESFKKFHRQPSALRRRLLAARNWYREQNGETRRQLRERWQRSALGSETGRHLKPPGEE